MSITHRLNASFGANGILGAAMDVAADSEQNISVSLADASNNTPLGVDWPAGKLQSIFIKVSKDCTLYVNAVSGGSPSDTIPLKADFPFEWVKDSGMRVPFVGTAGAITAMYVSVPTTDPTEDCQFDLRAAIDF